MRFYKLLSLIILLTATANAMAEIYRWTEENGDVHFTDKPVKGVEHEKLNYDKGLETDTAAEKNKSEPMSAEEMEKLADELKESRLKRELAREKRKAELERKEHEETCQQKKEQAGRLKYEIDQAQQQWLKETRDQKEKTISAKTFKRKSELKHLQEDIRQNCS